MSNILNIVKTIWKNDRYRSLLFLSLYFIFFLGIIVIAKVAPKSEVKVQDRGISNIEINDTYSFEVSIKDNVIKGTYDYSYIKFEYNGIEYEYSNDILLPNKFEYMDIIKFMNRSYVFDLIKDKEAYSTTKFKSGNTSKTYLVDNIEITTYDKELYNVDIKINDLTYKITYK